MDNNYHPILAILQKSLPTPRAIQRTFFISVRKIIEVFSFSIETKKTTPISLPACYDLGYDL
jgi:hypothetical protein